MPRTLPRVTPPFSAETVQAAQGLRYRDFLIVALILKDRGLIPDNWIYIHDPGVKVGRIQNFKTWSPYMVPDPAFCCYGMEYFCSQGDGLWEASDAQLVARAKREIEELGLALGADVVDAAVVRQPQAYPIYDQGYASKIALIRREIEARFPTLHVAGRNGMHFYNSQDHAMMTAILEAWNIVAPPPTSGPSPKMRNMPKRIRRRPRDHPSLPVRQCLTSRATGDGDGPRSTGQPRLFLVPDYSG